MSESLKGEEHLLLYNIKNVPTVTVYVSYSLFFFY